MARIVPDNPIAFPRFAQVIPGGQMEELEAVAERSHTTELQ